MAQYIRTVENNNFPITLEEAKAHLRVVSSFDNTDIDVAIAAAVNTIENYTWRPLMQQTWKLYLDSNEVISDIIINKAPLISVDSIEYYDVNNNIVTLTSDNYYTDLVGDPARVKITTMPQVYDRFNSVVITFKCGYCALSEVVDADSVSHAHDTITKDAHGLINGQMVVINALTNITNLVVGQVYYVVNKTDNTFQLSNTVGGDAINILGSNELALSYQSYTSFPSALKSALKLIIGHLFEHREDVVIGASVNELPMNSNYLLEPFVNKYIYR